MGPIAGLDALEKSEIPCSYLELNHNSSYVQLVALSLYLIRYTDIKTALVLRRGLQRALTAGITRFLLAC